MCSSYDWEMIFSNIIEPIFAAINFDKYKLCLKLMSLIVIDKIIIITKLRQFDLYLFL